jgi:ABC-type uncharacterized transport system substrate-binding protein
VIFADKMLKSVRSGDLPVERPRPWLGGGQNVVMEYRWAEGHYARLPALAAELVHLPVDVLVTAENAATAAARQATSTIPIVMVVGSDPVGVGFIASLSRPGGNITGTAWTHPEMAGKILQVLTEVVPHARRITVILNPVSLGLKAYAKANVAAGRALGVVLRAVEVRQPDEVDTDLVSNAHDRPDALYVVGDPVVATHRTQILAFPAQYRESDRHRSLPSHGANSAVEPTRRLG